jgi:hypothetical protein
MEALSFEEVLSVVKRLVNAGPLALLPKKRGDQTVLLALASARFDSARVYREDEVNETLQAWLEKFTSPITMDHVSFRRQMVDEYFFLRDAAGNAYRVNGPKLDREIAAAARTIDPGAVMATVRAEREERKRARAG